MTKSELTDSVADETSEVWDQKLFINDWLKQINLFLTH